MSELTAQSIKNTLSGFDTFVRAALEEGDMVKVSGKEEQIVSRMKLLLH